ncbi:MAG: hypothetical protein QNI90_04825 [Dinoroseobacter sp.]|nr:hypothetical protein [Dinoroseobacter sp.]
MSPVQRTLLIILAFVVITAGSFIWYVTTWDPTENEPVSFLLREDAKGSGAEPWSTLSHPAERPT